MIHLDKADAAMLQALQKNVRLTTDELGELVHLSPSACQRRMKRLRDAGVIEAEVAVLSPEALGRTVTVIVLVSLERERSDIVDDFKATLRETKEVMMAYYATGDADFMLVLTARSMKDYEQFTRRFFRENPAIKAFKTMVVMDRVKAGFEFPIDADDPPFSKGEIKSPSADQ